LPGLRRYILRKAAYLLITLLAIATLNFLMFHVLPGDPAAVLLPGRATQEAIEQLRARLGLDQPLYVQYGIYLNSLVQLDLGDSWFWKTPVVDTILPRLERTLVLVGIATAISVFIGVAAGIRSAAKRGKPFDVAASGLGLFFYSTPAFWLGMLLLLMFAVEGSLGWFPLRGYYDISLRNPTLFQFLADRLWHLFLPALTFTLVTFAAFLLVMRNTLIDILTDDYITTARAKGLTDQRVLRQHAVPNAMLPTIANTAMYVGYIVTGAIQIEVVFSWDGIGRLTWDALQKRDFPVLQGIFLILATALLAANFVADLVSYYVDPRVKR